MEKEILEKILHILEQSQNNNISTRPGSQTVFEELVELMKENNTKLDEIISLLQRD